MFDFYFGTKDDIDKNEASYLLFIKRMLPRWCNSIPDSEYLAIHNSLNQWAPRNGKPVLAETGTGASTIALLNYALRYDGVLYSWDTNGTKGAFLRSVFVDTLVSHYGKNLSDHWKFIAYNSLSPQLGVSVLAELGAAVDYVFIDSEHTREVLLGELTVLNRVLKEQAVVAIDDANYDYIHTNISYINMLRKKLGLPPAPNPPDNKGDAFYVETERFLKARWSKVEKLPDTYKKDYQKDLFWSYFSADREAMGKADMEKLGALDHRFDCWRVSERQ